MSIEVPVSEEDEVRSLSQEGLGQGQRKTIDDVVVIREQEGGLYKLKGHPEKALIHDIVEPNEPWHRRLAHVHYRALPMASKDVPKFQAI